MWTLASFLDKEKAIKKHNNNLLLAVAVSLLLHTIGATGLLILTQRLSKTSYSLFDKNPIPTFVGVEFGTKSAQKQMLRHMGHVQRPKQSPRTNIRINQLGVSLYGTQNTRSDGVSSREKGKGTSQFGFEGQITEESDPTVQYLYRKLHGNIGYPSEIYSTWRQGTVDGVLTFDSHGNWIDNPTDMNSYSDLGGRYLRIHVLRKLRVLLKDPIPETIWKTTKQPFKLKVRFIFAIHAPEGVQNAMIGPKPGPPADPTQFSKVDSDENAHAESQLNDQREGRFGESIVFYQSHLASKLAWKLGPFAGYGIMPGVGLDPNWFSETLDKWIHPRATIDPLEKYREDPEW